MYLVTKNSSYPLKLLSPLSITVQFQTSFWLGIRGGEVASGTALQARMWRVWFPVGSLEFFIDSNPFSRTIALVSTQPLTEMSIRNISWQVKAGQCVGLTTLPPSRVYCLEILEASTSWTPKSLSRPVMW